MLVSDQLYFIRIPLYREKSQYLEVGSAPQRQSSTSPLSTRLKRLGGLLSRFGSGAVRAVRLCNPTPMCPACQPLHEYYARLTVWVATVEMVRAQMSAKLVTREGGRCSFTWLTCRQYFFYKYQTREAVWAGNYENEDVYNLYDITRSDRDACIPTTERLFSQARLWI